MEYNEYLADIEIAKNELKRIKLYPGNIVADFYCIPSHNHQAYYASLSIMNNEHVMTYIKPWIYETYWESPVKMYPFAWCKQAENHPAKQGTFIMGIKKVTNKSADKLLRALDELPARFIEKETSVCIDGVTQGIRLFTDNPKEVFFTDANHISGLSSEYSSFFNLLYLEIERIIEA